MSALPGSGIDPASEPSAPVSLPRTLPETAAVFWSHSSPRVLLAAFALALTWRVAVGGVSLWDAAPIAGLLLFWPIQEWLIHVFILHRQPIVWRGRTVDFRVPRKHRAHHADPWRLDLVFIPVHSFVYSLPILVASWFLLMPTAALALTGICAHLALSLHYEWVHTLCHTRVTPRLAYYQRLVKNHRRHHFKNERYWYGVTMLGGDRLLGTAPEPGAVATSPTARTLTAVRPEAA